MFSAFIALSACGGDSTDTSADGPTCGEGTVERDGMCVAVGEPDPGSTCGEGTVEVEGECVAASDSPPAVSGFTVTQLSLTAKGRPINGGEGDPVLAVDHPVEVTVGIRYEGDAMELPLVMALGEAAGSGDGTGLCLLGGLAVDHPGTGEVVATGRFVLSETCLADNQEGDTAGAAVSSRTMLPVLFVDPDDTLGIVGDVPKGVIFSAERLADAQVAFQAQAEAIANGEQPMALDPEHVSLLACHRSGHPDGSCGVELAVEESDGIDFELTAMALESSVLVLNRCFASQAELNAYAADPARGETLPTGYICNRSIVRGFDDEGNPLPKGNEKDFTYGAADVDVDVTVTSFGLDDSIIESADELMALGTETDDGFQLNVAPEDISNNALGADGSYTIQYFLRPVSAPLQTAQDASLAAAIERLGGLDTLEGNGTLARLYLHAEGEQAKAGDEATVGGQAQASLEETLSIPQVPTEYSHGLYVENDCGRFNDPTRRPGDYNPEVPACNPAINPRDALLYGAMRDANDFVVLACVTGTIDAALPGSDDLDNNCVEQPLRVLRAETRRSSWAAAYPEATPAENPYRDDPDAAAPGRTRDELFAAGDADGYAANYDWNQRFGNNEIGLDLHAHSRNGVSLQGAGSDNEAKLSLSSNTFSFSLELVRMWAQADARSIVIGSFYDFGLSFFGAKLWGERQEVPEYHREWDWNVTKEWGKSKSIFVKIAWVDVGVKVAGQSGVRLNLDIIGRELEDCSSPECNALRQLYSEQGTDTVGEASITLTPYGNINANIFAAVSIQVARAGAAGDLTIANLELPARGALTFGLVGSIQDLQNARLQLAAFANLQLNSQFLNGRLYLFAENRSIHWCSSWGIPYPCGLSWNKFWDQTIASWNGWSYNQVLWASPTFHAALTRNGVEGGRIDHFAGNYQLRALHSNKCMDSYSDGNTKQWGCVGAPHHVWRFEDMGDGSYRIINNQYNKCLDVAGAGTHNGANVITWSCHNGANQRFRLLSRGGSDYALQNVHSGRCVEVGGYRHEDNANMNQWDCHYGPNQIWRLFRQ